MSVLGSTVSTTTTTLINDDRSSTGRDSETRIKTGDDDDDKPAWTEMKTKAGKERKRLPLACIACRRKKIRCSGEKPACKHCSKARIPCVYKVTTRKPAPRTDYMTMLDKRLKRMEERVIKLSPEHDASKLAAIGRSSVKPYISPAQKSATTKKRFAEDAFANELNDWANEPPGTQQATGVPHTDLRDSGLLSEGREYLPSSEIQEHLAEVYFDYLYGQSYHVLHKPSFMRKLKAGKVPPVLILTICALSARFSTHPQINTEPMFLRGEEWAEPARQISLRRYNEPSITILIVYLLLGLHEFGTCQGGRSWMFGGMALRMAFALQLHHELDHNPKGQQNGQRSELSFTDREIRRRTMWACFLMDRFNSSGTDRPVFASEQSIDTQLPIKEFNFQMEIPGPTEDLHGNVPLAIRDDPEQITSAKSNMGVAAYIVKIIALWGKVVKYVNVGGRQNDPYPIWEPNSDFNKLKQQLKDFLEDLPEEQRYTPDTLRNHGANNLANQLILIHIACSQIVLFLHKFAIPAAPGLKLSVDAPKDFIPQSTRNAIEAAGKIAMLVADAAEYRVSAPFVGYCAFAASTVHVWGIFSNNQSLEAISKRNLTYGIRYLTQMKRHWGMFHHMVENLKAIYKQHADLALKGHQAGAGGTADETMFQYGDWFRKYPYGISGDEFGDPIFSSNVDESANAPLYEKPELQSPEDFFAEVAKSVAPVPRKAARKQDRPSKPNARDAAPIIKKEKGQQPLGIPDDNQLLRNLSLSPDNTNTSSSNTLTTTQPTPSGPDLMQYNINGSTNFHPDHQQEMSAYTLNNQPLAISELDRQLVFGAYTQDFSTTATSSPQSVYPPHMPPHQQQHHLPTHSLAHIQSTPPHTQSLPVSSNPNQNTNAMLWDHTADYNMTGLGTQGYQDGLSGSAWMLPFNLVPPDIGAGEQDMGNHGHSHGRHVSQQQGDLGGSC